MRKHANFCKYIMACLVATAASSNSSFAIPPQDALVSLGLLDLVNSKSTTNDSRAAGGAQSSGVTLLSKITPGAFGQGASSANEAWGYVSPTGREYAIIGLQNAVGFVEVTDPVNPVIVGAVRGQSSIWRDMKVVGEYCYNVIEQTGLGLEIINLTNIDNGVVTLSKRTDLNAGMDTSHNIAYNEDSGFMYLAGSDLNSGFGLIAIDTTDPINPVVAGTWSGSPLVRCHDATVVSYTSGAFAGREIAFCFAGGSGVHIADVTDKNNMFTIGATLYPNVSFCHQGWLSEDRHYLFVGDEADENSNPNVTTTTTYVIDVLDLNNPQFFTSFTNGLPSIDHNMIGRGDYLYQANYTSGLRIYDISDVNNVSEVGFYDTFPSNDSTGFSGAWGVYPLLPSGRVLVGDGSGLYIFDASVALGAPSPAAPSLAIGVQQQYNRYLAFDPTVNGATPAAIRVTHQGPGSPASPKFLTANGRTQDQIDENVFLLQDTPDFRVWTDPICFVADCIFSPSNSYAIQSTFDSFVYSSELVLSTTPTPADGRFYGDVVGTFDPGTQSWSSSDSFVNANDILAVVQKFQLAPSSPATPIVDIEPQSVNAIVNGSDILGVVLSFQFVQYPFASPDGCP